MLDTPDDDSYTTAPVREDRVPLRLSLLLWLLGFPGVLAMAWSAGQRMPSSMLPAWALPLLGSVQTGLLLLAATFLGAWLGPRVGLGAPLLQSWLQGRAVRPVLRSLWLPAIGGGVMGAAWLVTLAQLTLDFVPGDPIQAVPLWGRLLYGGITEELLLRWGLLSVLLFVLWRVLQPHGGTPRRTAIGAALLLSALLSACASLPLASLVMGGLSGAMVAHALVSHTVLGLMLGFIYWRHGLETAIVAHVLSLLLSYGLT